MSVAVPTTWRTISARCPCLLQFQQRAERQVLGVCVCWCSNNMTNEQRCVSMSSAVPASWRTINAGCLCCSSNNMTDEQCWGSLWLYKATGEQQYLDVAKKYYDPSPDWGMSWDDVIIGNQVTLPLTYLFCLSNRYQMSSWMVLTFDIMRNIYLGARACASLCVPVSTCALADINMFCRYLCIRMCVVSVLMYPGVV